MYNERKIMLSNETDSLREPELAPCGVEKQCQWCPDLSWCVELERENRERIERKEERCLGL